MLGGCLSEKKKKKKRKRKEKGEMDRAPVSGASDAFLNELSVEVSSCRFTRWRR